MSNHSHLILRRSRAAALMSCSRGADCTITDTAACSLFLSAQLLQRDFKFFSFPGGDLALKRLLRVTGGRCVLSQITSQCQCSVQPTPGFTHIY